MSLSIEKPTFIFKDDIEIVILIDTGNIRTFKDFMMF